MNLHGIHLYRNGISAVNQSIEAVINNDGWNDRATKLMSLLKIDLTNKTTTEINFQASSETYYECAFSIFL